MSSSGGEARLFSRELSWLEFNQRVLDEAMDPSVPALERLKFLAITASNLDEFFMVRVGGLEWQVEQHVTHRDAHGMTAAQQLEAIRQRAMLMVGEQYRCFLKEIEPRLAKAGIRRVALGQWNPAQSALLDRYFARDVHPTVTPMAVHDAAGFPLLVNLGLNVAVELRPGEGGATPRYALIPVGAGLDRIVPVPEGDGGFSYVLLEDVVRGFVERIFPGIPVRDSVVFRLTRNADLAVQEDGAADLLAEMEAVLRERKQSECVRLEIEGGASESLRRWLLTSLGVSDRQVYEATGPLALRDLMRLASMPGFNKLKYEPWPPQATPKVDPRQSIFEVISRKPVLLCHPFESFDPVVRLVTEAAEDRSVLAIKQILYRTSSDSPVVAALRTAAERGKYVTALVELKARFDEARNIEWARDLERAGVQVIYGIRGLKTHAKVCIVVRREPQGVVRYLHFGTGNYNEKTAQMYTDVSYMTRDEDLGADASAFFNAICGYSAPREYLKIAAAPLQLRDRLVDLIASETARARQGQPGLIMAKMNSLVDPRIIEALYEASGAGVRVRLNVRGVCCLRPGVPAMSENIEVVSIVDRFLEHSRIFYFQQGGEERIFISSADWMQRNFDRRVELLVPVEDPAGRKQLVDVLETCLADTGKGRLLLPDGQYVRRSAPDGGAAVRSQEALYGRACDSVKQIAMNRPTAFESHRPRNTRKPRRTTGP